MTTIEGGFGSETSLSTAEILYAERINPSRPQFPSRLASKNTNKARKPITTHLMFQCRQIYKAIQYK